MREKILRLLGLMRRASAIAIGESQTGDAVRGGKARLLLIASDASDNARKRAAGFAAGRSVLTVPLPFTKEELADSLGTGACSMAAVTDMGFADALMQLMAEQWPEDYGEAAEEIARRRARMDRRKRQAGKSNKSNGKKED